VVDGDTIRVTRNGGAEKVRIVGVDTPDSGECGYARATSHLEKLIAGQKVQLVTAGAAKDDRDQYDRLLRYVQAGSTDVGYRQIADGYAVARYDSRDGYGWHRREAAYIKADAANAPAYTCTTPKPAPPKPTTPADSGACEIKGNISSSGEKIYHLPGMEYYDVTKITLSRGERWFCSETAAVNAGWRKSKR